MGKVFNFCIFLVLILASCSRKSTPPPVVSISPCDTTITIIDSTYEKVVFQSLDSIKPNLKCFEVVDSSGINITTEVKTLPVRAIERIHKEIINVKDTSLSGSFDRLARLHAEASASLKQSQEKEKALRKNLWQLKLAFLGLSILTLILLILRWRK